MKKNRQKKSGGFKNDNIDEKITNMKQLIEKDALKSRNLQDEIKQLKIRTFLVKISSGPAWQMPRSSPIQIWKWQCFIRAR